jgi:hypothetical protein
VQLAKRLYCEIVTRIIGDTREQAIMSEQSTKTRFGLTPAEYDNLMEVVRYGIIIVVAVLITFSIVGIGAKLVGYEPPSSGGVSAEVTPETSAIIFSEYLAS